LEDRGETCSTHRYVVAPATNTLLTFEVVLSPQQAAAISPGRLQFNDNRWQEIDVSPFFGYCRIESAEAALNRWVVDGRDFLKDSRERGKAPVFTSIGEVLIVWGPDGIGTITQTRRWKSEEDLGQLSPAQIAEQLAGATTIDYTDPDSGKNYTWTADLRTVEKTVHALIIELSIDTPAGAPDTIARNLSVGDDANQWTISAQYSDFRNVFIVTGPGQQLTCLSEKRL
jgi:hypothetical protein